MNKLLLAVCAALAMFASGAKADNLAEVVSPDGQTVTPYATAEAALESLMEDGCTVRLLGNNTNTKDRAPIVRSCTVDLNGYTITVASGTTGHGILIDTGCTVTIKNGNLKGATCLFRPENNSKLYLENCHLQSGCLCYCSVANGTEIHLKSGTIHQGTSGFVSAWCSDNLRIHVYDGAFCVFPQWNDNANNDTYRNPQVPRIQVHGGSFTLDPTKAIVESGKFVLAGKTMKHSNVANADLAAYFTVCSTDDATAKATYDNAEAEIDAETRKGSETMPRAATIGDALTAVNGANSAKVMNGATVRMLKTVAMDKDYAFPAANVTNTIDMGGFDLTATSTMLKPEGCLKLTNGSVYNTQGSTVTAIWLTQGGCCVHADSTVSFPNKGYDNLAFVLGTSNVQAFLDGTKIGIRLFSEWNPTGYNNTCITVTGNAEFTGQHIAYSDGSSPAYVDIRGGSWSQDPTKFLGEGCVFYQKGASVAPPWYVADFVRQTYDLENETELHVFTGTVPAGVGTVTMKVSGPLPTEPREIADFSGMDGYRDLVFSLEADEAGGLVFKNGKLSVMAGTFPFVWTGESATSDDWTDSDNWRYGAVPSADDDVYVSNTVAGAKINLNVPVTVKTISFDGAGDVTVEGANALTVTSSANVGETATEQECLFNSIPVTFAVPVNFTGAVGCGFYNRSSAKNANGYGLEFRKKVTVAGTQFVCSSYGPAQAATCFRDELDAPNAKVYDQYQKNYLLDFYGKVTCQSAHFSVWNTPTVSFYAPGNVWTIVDPGGSGTVHFRVAGACCPTGVIQAGWDKNFGDSQHTVNFGNFDTVADRLVSKADYLSTYAYDPAHDQKRCSLRSYGSTTGDTRPVTLTLNGTASALCDMRLMDAVSLVWNPTDAAYVQTFTNRMHTTTGSLTVRKGTLRLTGLITFANVPKITVDEGARFELLSLKDKAFESLADLELGANARFRIAATATNPLGVTAMVTLGEDARFEMDEGGAATVCAVNRGGTYVPNGRYTGEEGVDGATKVDWIEGSGVITVDSGTVAIWRGTSGGDWSDPANWTTDPSGANVVDVRIINPTAEDIAINVGSGVAKWPTRLKVLNEGAGCTRVNVNADIEAKGAFIDIGRGAKIVVAADKEFLYDGANTAAVASDYPVQVHDGGEFRVDGGSAVFTNFTGRFRIYGDTDATGRVTVASGLFRIAPKAADHRVLVDAGGLFEALAGTVHLIAAKDSAALANNGGAIRLSGNAEIVGDFASGNFGYWNMGDGEVVFAGASQYRYLAAVNMGTLLIVPTAPDGTARLAVLEHAGWSGCFDWFDVGSGKADRSKAVFEVDTEGSLGSQSRSLSSVICIASEPYSGDVVDGEMIMRNGEVWLGDRGVFVGWHGNFNGNASGRTATGVLRMSGGTLTMNANCWDGRNGAWFAPLGGVVAGVGMNGVQRTGIVDLSGGSIVNRNGSLLLGMSDTGVGRYVQTGGSYSGPRGENRKVVVGAGGGVGEFAISNGTFAAAGTAWVGGVLTNEFVFNATDSAYTWAEHGYTADRHDAKGTFVFAGGDLSIGQAMNVGADGEGTLVRYGSKGTMTVDSLTLSNATKSVARFVADADGLKPIKVTKELAITDGAELEIDLREYTAGKKFSFRLFDCGSIAGAFDPAKVTYRLAEGMPDDFQLVKSGGILRFSSPHGTCVIVR